MDQVIAAEKQYIDIAEKRNINYPYIEKALVIVRKFIQDRKRTLYGGMAIDLNLKSAGHPGIYSDSAIPDYDIMSPEFFQDSLDLADILHKAGLPGVSAINQLHITGRRVRVNFVTVCDIGYVPPDVYDRIPRREITNLPLYRGLWVVSPDFQRLDIHRAFSYPYENAPQETILHRFAKDQKRFRMLDEQFPLEAKPSNGVKDADANHQTSVSFTWRELEGQAITGFLAYSLLRRYLEHLLADAGSISKSSLASVDPEKLKELRSMFSKIPRHDAKITDTGIELEWNLPMRARVSILSNDYEEFLRKQATGRKLRYYTRFLDGLRPRAVRFFWFSDNSPKNGFSAQQLHELQGDNFEAVSLLPRIVRKLQDLEVIYPLRASRKLAKLVEEFQDFASELESEKEVSYETFIYWCNQLRVMWELLVPDIEISNPTSQATKKMIESLPTADQIPKDRTMPASIPELEVLDCMGSLIPAFSLREAFQALGQICQLPKDLAAKVKTWPANVYIAHGQYHLMHFLQGAFERPYLARIYREYYINTTQMIVIMERVAQELFRSVLPNVSANPQAWSLYRTIPFFLGTETLGTLTRNYNLSYLVSVRERLVQIQSSLPNVLIRESDIKSTRPPFGYYPEREGGYPTFSVEDNPLFQMNGQRCSKEIFDSLNMRILVPEILRDPDASVVVQTESEDE